MTLALRFDIDNESSEANILHAELEGFHASLRQCTKGSEGTFQQQYWLQLNTI